MIRRVLAWGALLSYCALIFWQSSQSHPPIVDRLNWSDKLLHLMGYAVLGFLASIAARVTFERWRNGACAFAGTAFATLFGASDEFHQSFTPGRSPDVKDLVADALGAAFAATVFLALLSWRGHGKRVPT